MGKFTKIDFVLGQKTILSKYIQVEIIKKKFTDHKNIILKSNNK